MVWLYFAESSSSYLRKEMSQRRLFVRHRIPILALVFITLTLATTVERAYAAVTIQSFTAKAQTSSILVEWKTASEISNAGFNLYRSTLPNGPWTTKINSSLIPACPGCYNVSHSFTDSGALKGQTYYYKLENVEFNGGTQQFGPVNAAISTPTATPTTAAPTATSTTTAPTASRTLTTVVTATATDVSASSNPTATDNPTAYSSPTPLGTPPPTSTRIPTRVALFVDPAAPSPTVAAPRARPNNNPLPPAPPKSEAPLSVPTIPAVVASPIQHDSPATADNSTDEALPDSTPARSAERNPLLVAVTLIGGVAAMTVIAVGAVSFYLIVRRFIR